MREIKSCLTHGGDYILTKKECIQYVKDHMVTKYAKQSGPYTSEKRIGKVVGCINHSFGVAQPSIDKMYDSMNSDSSGYGVHAILGDFHLGEGKIYVTLPWDRRPWGCGSGSKGSWNADHVQWEVCEPAGHKYNGGTMIDYDVKKNQTYFDRMWKMLVCWNVYCADKFGYSASAIKDHSEAHAAGYGTNHADMSHWLPKHKKSMDALRKEVGEILSGKEKETKKKSLKTTTKELLNLTEAQVVEKMGPSFTEDQKKTGILASLSFAQFILESGYGKTTELAKNANNCFGMKKTLSGNTWSGSTWDGKSTYTVLTREYINGQWITKFDEFRKYPCIEDSIADHSAYLLGAMNGSDFRYSGLKNCTDFKKAAKIVKNGGYATDPDYVDKLVIIYNRWNLARFEVANKKTDFKEVDDDRFMVHVEIDDLRIRKGPGTNYDWTGKYTGVGTFTIVDVRIGRGSDTGWGLLLSYEKDRNGWIALDYAKKV